MEKVSLLAIAWDRKVQVAKLVKSELKMNGKWSLESAAIGVAWLDDQACIHLELFSSVMQRLEYIYIFFFFPIHIFWVSGYMSSNFFF